MRLFDIVHSTSVLLEIGGLFLLGFVVVGKRLVGCNWTAGLSSARLVAGGVSVRSAVFSSCSSFMLFDMSLMIRRVGLVYRRYY